MEKFNRRHIADRIDEFMNENVKPNHPATVVAIRTRKIDLEKRLDTFEVDFVAVESPIQLILNGKSLVTIMALPSNLRELVIGFLVDEGVVPSKEDILKITINRNKILINSKTVNQERHKSISKNGIIVTSCSSRKDFYCVIGDLKAQPLRKNFRNSADDILQMVNESIREAKIFRSTGGVHWASVFVEGLLKGYAEDVGRHNAVDKAIGMCLEKDLTLDHAILITSGRQTSDIVIKAARCRIPVSVSMRAPLSSGVYAAELIGVTLICFARGRKMNIYSHPERVNPVNAMF